jgi:hypothetical protein
VEEGEVFRWESNRGLAPAAIKEGVESVVEGWEICWGYWPLLINDETEFDVWATYAGGLKVIGGIKDRGDPG